MNLRKTLVFGLVTASSIAVLAGTASAHTAGVDAECYKGSSRADDHPEGAVATTYVDGVQVDTWTFDDVAGNQYRFSTDWSGTESHVIRIVVSNTPIPFDLTDTSEPCEQETTTTVKEEESTTTTSTTVAPSTSTTTTTTAPVSTEPSTTTTTTVVPQVVEESPPLNESEQQVQEVSEFVPAETNPPGQLPATGNESLEIFIGGLLAFVLGLGMILLSRRGSKIVEENS